MFWNPLELVFADHGRARDLLEVTHRALVKVVRLGLWVNEVKGVLAALAAATIDETAAAHTGDGVGNLASET